MTDPFGTEALRTSVLSAWRGSPTRFREDANAEEDLRLGGYRDRLLVELAQNAADAAGAEPGVLRITLVDGELRAANTGAPLTAAGVAALASLRASSKESGVGQFGVGFAAVLAVSDAPRVMSSSGGVEFSASRTRAEVPELASERGGDVPVLRLVWPVTETVPDGFTTEVRLPLKVELSLDDLASEVPDLLLALPGLRRVEVGSQSWERFVTSDGVVTVGSSRWLVERTVGELPAELVAGVEQRPQWTVSWAFPLEGELGEDVLHAPTPTDERLSLPARLIATLPVEPSRRRILPGPAAWSVLDAAAAAYPALVARVPAVERTALVPLPGFPLSEVDDRLRTAVIRELRTAEWLPLASGEWIAPARARVLDVGSEELVDLVEDALPGLLDAELSAPVHARALAALEVPRVTTAEVVAALTEVSGDPGWWHDVYAALSPLAEVDPDVREALASLPVPLADGRVVTGPRTTLIADEPLPGLRVVHPDAVHPLLVRLGAVEAGAAELLADPSLRENVARSLEDAEAGLDGLDLVETVLRLVDRASVRAGEEPWLGALALPDGSGEWHRADELLLPDSPLVGVLEADALPLLSKEVAESYPRSALVAVGVVDGFSVVVDDSPSGPDHDLADESAWWSSVPDEPRRVVAVRDLDLVADWPAALRLLASDPVTWRAVAESDGYTGWWIARYASLGGAAPRSYRLADASLLDGLFDVVPDVELPEHVLRAAGVRSSLEVLDDDDAEFVLDRLGDADRVVADAVVLRAYAALPEGDFAPPSRVRVLSGDVVDADDVVVLDHPWLLGVVPAARVLLADGSEELADLLDLALASEEFDGSPDHVGEVVAWSELGAVRMACELLEVSLPDGVVVVHEALVVDGSRVEWWMADGVPHAADTPEGLARALAWVCGRWGDRHAFAALITDPRAATLLG
ncbi:sacsin N-terminal ATP-binding-like domain-containing protein [Lentzea sp. NPDC058436]|uniref:sacsin N-terminal ATP-binding-like domain-containing protein n=1 Tax=Lentzea sp. NPDC058436 TaxID=3346499 RepID=UPI003666BBED